MAPCVHHASTNAHVSRAGATPLGRSPPAVSPLPDEATLVDEYEALREDYEQLQVTRASSMLAGNQAKLRQWVSSYSAQLEQRPSAGISAGQPAPAPQPGKQQPATAAAANGSSSGDSDGSSGGEDEHSGGRSSRPGAGHARRNGNGSGRNGRERGIVYAVDAGPTSAGVLTGGKLCGFTTRDAKSLRVQSLRLPAVEPVRAAAVLVSASAAPALCWQGSRSAYCWLTGQWGAAPSLLAAAAPRSCGKWSPMCWPPSPCDCDHPASALNPRTAALTPHLSFANIFA